MGESLGNLKVEHDTRGAHERQRPSRSPRRRSRSRHGTRSTRHRHDYERDERRRDNDYGRRERSRTRRRRSRSRSASNRHRNRSRDSSYRREVHRAKEVIPLHLRPKKLQLWDLPPAGFENVTCLVAKSSGMFPPPGQSAGSRNVASFNPSVLFEHTHRDDNDRFRPSSRGEREFPSTAQRQARRLYVGNIPFGVDEDSIASFFNDLMVRTNIAPPDELPVQNIQINHDKNYAFVEVRNAEQATMGMGLDGVMFQNQKVKIRRPKDYIPPPGESEPKPPALNIPGVLSNMVPDSPDKVYIGGIPTYLNEDQVMELLRAFGELKSFNLVKVNATGMSRGFAFCEYLDPNMTDIACQGLNNMELGDRTLVVQRASIGARSGANGVPLPMSQQQQFPEQQGYQHPRDSKRSNGGQIDYGNQHPPSSYAGTGVTLPPGMARAAGGDGVDTAAQATQIVQLLNMVTPADLADDAEYEDIVEDVRDECSTHGEVSDVVIPRNSADHPDTQVPGVGKVFVKFADVMAATSALNALAGRQFMGRTVIASYISEEDFTNRNY
ncbi:hypothetical protein COEREDRAFT_97055 [Coemansia reversa NRRL 1564]|uniref:Splicing factor U2AF subunit n=1 Tax=Coemansia reversa (strain ATCC 12441 / NRRL 1564) TaxID=763665 RepID=A0A2G5BDR2_COERN|nr:hypothetical protein COEREDRAFT_97055 [Coemansia reversa NRRL 1564]|eukprot:PIA17122.1 hypothetical protein COEREDRAFT_97055 [Coemansia reversa NRRL 1564]